MSDQKRYTRELIRVLQTVAKRDDETLVDEFLKDLFTPSEYQDIIVRWQIVKELAKGTPQREIAKKLDTSIATVTRGSRELKDPDGGFQRVIDLLEKIDPEQLS